MKSSHVTATMLFSVYAAMSFTASYVAFTSGFVVAIQVLGGWACGWCCCNLSRMYSLDKFCDDLQEKMLRREINNPEHVVEKLK